MNKQELGDKIDGLMYEVDFKNTLIKYLSEVFNGMDWNDEVRDEIANTEEYEILHEKDHIDSHFLVNYILSGIGGDCHEAVEKAIHSGKIAYNHLLKQFENDVGIVLAYHYVDEDSDHCFYLVPRKIWDWVHPVNKIGAHGSREWE